MAERKYVGARYVLVFDKEPWNKNNEYEPLTAVKNGQQWYVSRQYVPTGIDIDNEIYWLLYSSGNKTFAVVTPDSPFLMDGVHAAELTVTNGDSCWDILIYDDGNPVIINRDGVPIGAAITYDYENKRLEINATDTTPVAVFVLTY